MMPRTEIVLPFGPSAIRWSPCVSSALLEGSVARRRAELMKHQTSAPRLSPASRQAHMAPTLHPSASELYNLHPGVTPLDLSPELNFLTHTSLCDVPFQVGSVIRNPEVAVLVPALLAAIADPSKATRKTLDTLLDTVFINTVDAASLALIVPVVNRGLRDRLGDTKKKAARIVGNMCALINEPKVRTHPPLRTLIIDGLPRPYVSCPEIRTAYEILYLPHPSPETKTCRDLAPRTSDI